MRVSGLLHKLFEQASTKIDKRIHRTLLLASSTLSEHKHLSITGIGRTMTSQARVKHTIKRVDRLFGHRRLQHSIHHYYSAIASHLITPGCRPIIIIDWSGLTKCGEYHFLRAAIPCGGRALPILDMTFPLSEYAKKRTHKKFLSCLKEVLPAEAKPIIVTDAGFRVPWYQAVMAMGWDFVGRVRHNTQYAEIQSANWFPIKSLYQSTTNKAQYIGLKYLTKANRFPCHFHTVKLRKKGRVKKNLAGKKVRCSASLKHSKRGNEPWLVVTSLSPQAYSSYEITNIYRKRMQVEESIRDLKNMRNGFGLRHCRSFHIGRLNVALLIAAMALLLLWVIGLASKMNGGHRQYQANTIRHRNVLSNFIIGWQVLIKSDGRLPTYQIDNAIASLKQEAAKC